ncbi:Hpt domain-containing protein [Sneathiella chinensis]|uniref:HPt domain-containing protein n=1 Tax=Sneathiella chinensis TaxID=349750 RepID=A0ABQ5U454_9PROT|nr:Hpt domain-containing protein [Sneathiella chinensis]GLQ06945.1 hypothetical protein GCM10007924_21660 [Sneathiella chinensis]
MGQSAEWKTLPVGDLAYLKNLADHAGLEMAQALVSSAPDAFSHEIDVIRDAIEAHDLARVRSAAHALKGACYSVQSRKLAAVVAELEKNAADPDVLPALFKTVEQVGEETLQWLREVLEKDLA